MELIIGKNRMQEVEGVTAEYPYTLNRADSRRMQVPWHWHEEVEFSYVRQGALRVSIAGRQQMFREGEGFFLNANVLHAMEPENPQVGAVWDSHMVHPALLGGSCKSVFETKYMAPILRNRNLEWMAFRETEGNVGKLLEKLQLAADVHQKEFAEFQTRIVFSEIWLLLLEEMKKQETESLPNGQQQERLRRMLEFIHQNYQEKLTLDQIAAAANISKRECLRCFQSCMQKTPFAYLLDFRVQAAERFLRTSGLSVTEIAAATGFFSSAYFAKIFRERKGQTPSQFRKEAGIHDLHKKLSTQG